MKPTQLLARRMWIFFGIQAVMSLCIGATFAVVCSILLHAVETSDQNLANRMPAIQQQIATEQDVAALRRDTITLWGIITEDDKTKGQFLRYGIYGSLGFGFALLAYSFYTAMWAYKVGRLETSDRGQAGG